MSKKVLIPQSVTKIGIDFLLGHGYEVLGPIGGSKDELLSNASTVEAILLRSYKADMEILDAAKDLRIVARHGAGFDNVDIVKAAELGVWVTNTPLATITAVAEYAFAAILLLAKQIPLMIDGLKKGDFYIRMKEWGVDVEGKTLGVIGLGHIGSEVTKRALNGLGMRVLAFDPFCRPDKVPVGVQLLSEMKDVLKAADFVTLHMPSTPETKKLFSSDQFAAMKKTAYIINCARGEVVDETALIKALETGTIAGAAIDVYDPEPPSMDNPLLHMSNVIATPHIASNTVEANEKMALHAAQEIHRVLSGEKPLWPVNKPLNPRKQ
jgi:D-3-phosphoglycerate dehydrogenase